MKSDEVCDGQLNQIRIGPPTGPCEVPRMSPWLGRSSRGPKALRRRHVEYPNTCMVPQGTWAYDGHRQCRLAHPELEVKRPVTSPPGPGRSRAVHRLASRCLAEHWGWPVCPEGSLRGSPRVSGSPPGDPQGYPWEVHRMFSGIFWGFWGAGPKGPQKWVHQAPNHVHDALRIYAYKVHW